MERTKPPIRIPDAVNCSVSKNFTQIPNEMLRNPEISGKAKALLCILLSNKDGWTTYIRALSGLMKEGEVAIRSAIDELEAFGYLMRVKYRCEKTKAWRGSFWVYSDVPYHWDMGQQQELLKSKGLECVMLQNPNLENPKVANPKMENHALIIPKDKKTKHKNIFVAETENSQENNTPVSNGHITPSMFEKFWTAYPRKTDKGKAKTTWERICRKPPEERPHWRDIKKSLLAQKKSDRWQDKKFIPHPTTWLNQSRWLDDPAEMVTYKSSPNNRAGSRASSDGRLDEAYRKQLFKTHRTIE